MAAGERVRAPDPLPHREDPLRLKPRCRVHDLDELPERTAVPDLLRRRLLLPAQREEDLLLVEAQLFETSTARRAYPGDRIRAFCGPLDRSKSPS